MARLDRAAATGERPLMDLASPAAWLTYFRTGFDGPTGFASIRLPSGVAAQEKKRRNEDAWIIAQGAGLHPVHRIARRRRSAGPRYQERNRTTCRSAISGP